MNYARLAAKPFRIGGPLVLATLALAFAAVTSPAQAQTPVNIANFDSSTGGVIGPRPPGVITQGRDGNLYSSTDTGGANSAGGVFSVSPAGVLTTIYSFQTSDGNSCLSGVTLGNDGDLYGSCTFGGANNLGIVYKVTPGGTFTTLHAFSSAGGDGYEPAGPPVQASDGNFYGVTTMGGANTYGTVYKITPNGVVTTLHSFTYTDGDLPDNSLFQGSDGNLYGTTEYGGGNGNGEVFKMTLAGSVTILHSFNGTDGYLSESNIIQGKDGNYYGTTTDGGANGFGTIFKVTPAGAFTLLHSFTPGATGDGEYPVVGLVQATTGTFYGVVFTGGIGNGFGDGTLYKMTAAGVFTLLYYFDGTTSGNPVSLIQDTNGLIYGDTLGGGTHSGGVVYTLDIGAAPFAKLQSTSGKVGSTVALFGQGFTGTTAVSFNGVNATAFSVVSDTYLTATVPSGAKTGTVTVTTPGGNLKSSQQFKVTPTVNHIAPASGAEGSSVTITGTGLTQATKVTFGGVIATTFTVNSDTNVTATVPAGAKTGKIAVTTPGGTASSSSKFKVTPTITSFAPPSGVEGTAVTITGTGLVQATAVAFGGVAATTFTVNSDTQVTATVPAGAKTGVITVTTPGGTATSSSNFNVTPTITSFSPPSGPVGTVVTIIGTGLLQTTKVTFGGVTATTFTVNSDIQVTATVPTGAVTGMIAITTPGGTVISTRTFTVTP
jgi:uncharacterized repeat protein (TIGR03803 family)